MGILNVTPDSFSDGGLFVDRDAAIQHGMRLVEQGADILDVGGESTRPRAAMVSAEEEIARVVPVIEVLRKKVFVPISIDTMKPSVARAAVDAGASIINDVAANRENDEMWRLVAETGVGYVAVHMQGTPQNMQEKPHYENVVADVNQFFGERLSRLTGLGVKNEQIVLDPGIGFGKTVEHSLQLLRELRVFKQWGCPVLLGVSRKSFMGHLLGSSVNERLPAALACACWAAQCGVEMIRTHDVAETKQALRMAEALLRGV
ncbi:MAG: dihydropteroate synthase [Verrucomicrobia bacterium]|nr:dihydropteroate synthase [Verrucomicrobiota bacterium]